MTGGIPSPAWLSKDYLLLQFPKHRKTAIRKYQVFVEEGMRNGPIWQQIKKPIYLGDNDFIKQAQQYLEKEHDDIQIPQILKRPPAEPLNYYENRANDRDSAILAAYASGGYSYQQIGEHFGMHFTTVDRIVREKRLC